MSDSRQMSVADLRRIPRTAVLSCNDSTLPAGKRKLNYGKQLGETNDAATRLQLEKLLSEEEANAPSVPEARDED